MTEQFSPRWIEIPDYRGLIQRLAAMRLRSFVGGFPEALAAYDELSNEAARILKSAPDVNNGALTPTDDGGAA